MPPLRKNFEAAVTDFGQALGLLVRRVRAAATVPHELSFTESSVMSRLAKHGPATTAELARAESVKPQSMGAVIGTLEELGIVERTPHATDGRQVNIALTASGVALQKNRKEAKFAWLTQAIKQLDEQDQETLFEAAKIIRRLAELEKENHAHY